MGWASGSTLMDQIIPLVEKYVVPANQRKVYTKLIQAFENEDCDTLEECWNGNPEFEKAHKSLHPNWFDG